MNDFKLPNLTDSEEELKESINFNLTQYFNFWKSSNGKPSPNDKMTLAQIANQELERRSAKSSLKISGRAFRLSIIVVITTLISSLFSIYFSYRDFEGDKTWQELQLQKLENINQNLNQINLLRDDLDRAQKKISFLEEQIKASKK